MSDSLKIQLKLQAQLSSNRLGFATHLSKTHTQAIILHSSHLREFSIIISACARPIFLARQRRVKIWKLFRGTESVGQRILCVHASVWYIRAPVLCHRVVCSWVYGRLLAKVTLHASKSTHSSQTSSNNYKYTSFNHSAHHTYTLCAGEQ